MTTKKTVRKTAKPEFAPEEWRKAAIMHDASFQNKIEFLPGFDEIFDEALDTFPERNRDIVQKYFRDGMMLQQIADLHGVSENRIRQLRAWTVRRTSDLVYGTICAKKCEEDLRAATEAGDVERLLELYRSVPLGYLGLSIRAFGALRLSRFNSVADAISVLTENHLGRFLKNCKGAAAEAIRAIERKTPFRIVIGMPPALMPDWNSEQEKAEIPCDAENWRITLMRGVFGETFPDKLPPDFDASVDVVLTSLSNRTRTILKQYFCEGLSQTKIAELHGLTRETVRGALLRGAMMLRAPQRAEIIKLGIQCISEEPEPVPYDAEANRALREALRAKDPDRILAAYDDISIDRLELSTRAHNGLCRSLNGFQTSIADVIGCVASGKILNVRNFGVGTATAIVQELEKKTPFRLAVGEPPIFCPEKVGLSMADGVKLSELLKKAFNTSDGVRWVYDIVLPDGHKVDCMRFAPDGTSCAYEVRSSAAEFFQSGGHSLAGDFNYYVMPYELYPTVWGAIQHGIGVLCQYNDCVRLFCKKEAAKMPRPRPAEELKDVFQNATEVLNGGY